MSKILIVAMALTVAGCATAAPPAPKVPSERQRVPVNLTLPQEIQEVARGR